MPRSVVPPASRARRTLLGLTLGLGLVVTVGRSARSETPRASARRAVAAQAPDGQKIFAATCAACHQPSGQGTPGIYPPLAGSEWVAGDEARLVRIVLHGLTGEVEVEGETYSGAMPGWGATLNDADLAAVATYVRSSFGNSAPSISPATVAQIRAATASRTRPWTVAELAAVIPVHK